MNRRTFLAGVLFVAGLVLPAQGVAAADHPSVYVYTGGRATVVIDLKNASGAALYAYPRFDAGYNTTLTRLRRDHCHYYFSEDQYPKWCWKLAKSPTYCCYGRRRCRTCCCLGYKVQLIEQVGEKERVELCFYATRKKAGAFYPIPKEPAKADGRRQ